MMSLVVCCQCGREVAEHKARRELTVWARTGKGGTLSDIREPTATGRWKCDSCFHGLTLFEEPAADPEPVVPSRMADVRAALERKGA